MKYEFAWKRLVGIIVPSPDRLGTIIGSALGAVKRERPGHRGTGSTYCRRQCLNLQTTDTDTDPGARPFVFGLMTISTSRSNKVRNRRRRSDEKRLSL